MMMPIPLRTIRRPAGACTVEEKKEFAETNLTDHAGVRLTHGKPKVNGVEIHDASAAQASRCSCCTARRRPWSDWRHAGRC